MPVGRGGDRVSAMVVESGGPQTEHDHIAAVPGSDDGNLVKASALQLQSRCPAVMLVEQLASEG